MTMTIRGAFRRLMELERLNFLLTNCIARRAATNFMGWFSRIEVPWLARLSIWVWQRFVDLHLEEARSARFNSLHECFIRELKPGARPIDADPLTLSSPCDGIVGACGQIDGVRVFQIKGFPYTLHDLTGDPALVARYRNGVYATLRITADRYHRFHAPLAGSLREIVYISGDTWNVNPITLRRVEKLFCKNERAVLSIDVGKAGNILLVPVAAVLVASMRFRCLEQPLNLQYRGANRIPCTASFAKGDELGWFEHGSTILVFAPRGYRLAEGVEEGTVIRVGEALMRLPASSSSTTSSRSAAID
jgi:phosphatidylserine decarboxylase